MSFAGVMAALQLRQPRPELLRNMSDAEWRTALDFCDRSRLTLALRRRAREQMPAWVRERVDRNAARNCERLNRLRELYQTVASALKSIEFVTLKGMAQASLSDAPIED